jgi:hypothetical protein
VRFAMVRKVWWAHDVHRKVRALSACTSGTCGSGVLVWVPRLGPGAGECGDENLLSMGMG